MEKQKKREWGEEMKRVKGDHEILKLEKREKEMNDEQILADETRRMGELESQKELARKLWERENAESLKRENYKLQDLRENQKEFEEKEELRLREEKVQVFEEQERRVLAQKEKQAYRQITIDKVIQQRAKELTEIQKEKERFDSTQDGIQFEKERAAIAKEKERQERVAAERRRDYLDSLKHTELKRATKLQTREPKLSFPDEGDELGDLYKKRKQNILDISAYQRRQAAEKREREAKDKERNKLEFLRSVELEDANYEEAQEYAKEMLTITRKKRG